MKKQFDVSVIIPNYNCLIYLDQCLASIDQQQMNNLEIIIVDDGSTDGSRSYLTSLEKQRDDLTVLFEQGLGPGKARNVAVQIAQSDFIAFLDADDQWTADKLANQLAFLSSHADTVLSFTNYQHVQENHQPIISCFNYWPEFQHIAFGRGETKGYQLLTTPLSTLFKENIVGTSSVICRRDAFIQVGGFDTELPSASDWDLWLKLAKIGDVAFTTEIKMLYLMRCGSVSGNVLNRIRAMRVIADRHQTEAIIESPNAGRFIRERIQDAYSDYFASERHYLASVAHHFLTLVRFPTMKRFKQFVRASINYY